MSEESNKQESYRSQITDRLKTYLKRAGKALMVTTAAGMIASPLPSTPALADQKEPESVKPKTVWEKVLTEGKELPTQENTYRLQNHKKDSSFWTGEILGEKYTSIKAVFIDRDYNNEVSPADVGKIIRSKTLTGENNKKIYSELNLTDSDPTDMKVKGTNQKEQTIHLNEDQADALYHQQILPIPPKNKKNKSKNSDEEKPEDFWEYVKSKPEDSDKFTKKKIGTGEGKLWEYVKPKTEDSDKFTKKKIETGEGKLYQMNKKGENTSVVAQLYDNNGNKKIDSEDIGIVTFETQIYKGENLIGTRTQNIIDRNPLNFEDVIYITSLKKGGGSKGKGTKEMFAKFSKQLEGKF